MERGEVSPLEIQLAVGTVNRMEQLAVALAHGADDELGRQAARCAAALGASAAVRNQIKGSILNIDPVAAASASIPDLLDNAAFDAAMQSAVQALQSFAG